jgi:curved DNA-binding protein CbpA
LARSSAKVAPTHYQILQVHPAAPLDLITCAYWRLVNLAHAQGESDKASEIAVYHLTRSYQVLASPGARAEYDKSLGIATLSMQPHPVRKSSSAWAPATWHAHAAENDSDDSSVDYYSLLRLDPLANQEIVAECYIVMRNHYLRLVEQMQVHPELIGLFERAYEVISDPKRRREYDQAVKKRRRLAQTQAAEQAVRKNGKKPADKRTSGTESTNGVHTGERQDGGSRTAGRRGAPPRMIPDAGLNGGSSAQPARTPTAEPPGEALKVMRSLAASSAAVLKVGGKGSISWARKASQTLRDALLDVEPLEEDGLTPDEERFLLNRLSSVPPPPAFVETKPPVYQHGLLARLTLTGGPGLGSAFDIEAVPFTLGEDEGCDVALPGLAPEQARLLHRDGQFVLYSLTDEPKTRIHGDSIAWAVLHDGDSFEVGPYRLRFDSTSVATASA